MKELLHTTNLEQTEPISRINHPVQKFPFIFNKLSTLTPNIFLLPDKPSTGLPDSCSFTPVNKAKVLKLIVAFSSKLFPKHFIPNYLIKFYSYVSAEIITTLANNQSVSQDSFPFRIKPAQVIPLKKPGVDKDLPSKSQSQNINNMSKFLEHLILIHIQEYISSLSNFTLSSALIASSIPRNHRASSVGGENGNDGRRRRQTAPKEAMTATIVVMIVATIMATIVATIVAMIVTTILMILRMIVMMI